ncbi:MAG: tetratricopeptide repeat protein [Bryobacteraceae bacterium]
MTEVQNLLLSESGRLLTLTGAGGSGKTRLALQVVSQLTKQFPGGICFVALAATTDPDMVTPALARILGVRHTAGKPLTEVLQDRVRLALRAPTLLFIDNFEQVLTAAPILARLLEASRFLRILITSRATLHVYGEREYPVLPFPIPDPAHLPALEQLSENPAVRLFADRAAAVDPAFALTESNALAVVQICLRLDGLPLAIELAAARAKVLAPDAMLARLDRRLALLTQGARDAPARHRTLSRMIDWSYEQLSAVEQRLFGRLAVFAGGCTLESAEAVCNTRRDLQLDLLDGMSSLSSKSLLQAVKAEGVETRFLMLETIREYALERLFQSGEEEGVRRAHAAYCIVLAEENDLHSTDQKEHWLRLCQGEHDNLRAALNWLIARQDADWALRLGIALYWFWEHKEHLAEGRARLLAALNIDGGPTRTTLRAQALAYAGALSDNLGDYQSAAPLYQQSLEIYQELGEKKGVAAQLNSLGTTYQLRGDITAARPWYEQSLEACRELGENTEIAAAITNLASVINAQGDHGLARSLMHEALAIFATLGDAMNVAWSFNHLGDSALDSGNLSQARLDYEQGLKIFRGLGNKWGMGRSFADLGYLSVEENNSESAHAAFEQALSMFLQVGHKRGVAKVLEGFAWSAVRQGRFERALTLAGAAASFRQAIGVPSRPIDNRLDRSLEPHGKLRPSHSRRGLEHRLETAD